ncbi:MAG: hypothetical protein AAF384_02280 [Pseudomonadota bacterium]
MLILRCRHDIVSVPLLRRLSIILALLLICGCSQQFVSKTLYAAGDRYACQASNRNRHDERLRDAQCTGLAQAMPFDNYRQLRDRL